MKRIVSLGIVFLSMVLPLKADESFNNSIQVNLFEYISWISFPNSYSISLEYQRTINDIFSLSFTPHFYYAKINTYGEDY
jgi:hypothetical protein